MSNKFLVQFADPKSIVANDLTGNGFFGIGTTVPADATAGYTPGCIFIDNDAPAGANLWRNDGTAASCAFRRFDGGYAGRLVASGAALTLTQALHDGKTIVLAAAAAITLPAMTGSGARYRFVLPQDATAVTITATGAHLFGALNQNNDTAQGTGFQLPAINAGGATIITLDGVTKGGRKGDWVEIEDVAASVGIIRGQLNASGTEASPFS
jgi:hypothetical protein